MQKIESKANTTTKGTAIVGVLVTVIALLASASAIGWIPILDWLRPTDSTISGTQVDNSSAACACAQDRVSQMLKAPGTADFPWGCSEFVTSLGADKFLVNSYVDAQNSFGAMLRSNYSCEVTVTGDNECNASCQLE